MNRLLLKLFWGVMLGFVVSRIGFISYAEVHQMFLLADFRMFLSFAMGAALVVVYFLVINGFRVTQTGNMTPGTVPGSMLFGAGWALTGGCPAVILLQLSHGYVAALMTFVGVTLGMIAYRFVHERYFGWSAASCEA